jgi:serine/threonine protein kinase
MWSYGVLYYYLLRGSLPELNTETKTINIDILDTNRKNKNLIGKCLDQNVSKRLFL